jgi:hypothetical protein
MGKVAMNKITQADLVLAFKYDPDTGEFTRRFNVGPAKAGSIAGARNSNGHVQISFKCKLFMAHRLAWLYMTGDWPDSEIDHINRIRHDNRWANLRLSDGFINQHNASKRVDNTSGVKGVSWDKAWGAWVARVQCRGKMKNLGRFKSLEDAKEFIELAREMIHGEFACHG